MSAVRRTPNIPLRIILAYLLIGWLMAFPSYRLGLRPILAWCLVGIMALFGLYHAGCAYLTIHGLPRWLRRGRDNSHRQ